MGAAGKDRQLKCTMEQDIRSQHCWTRYCPGQSNFQATRIVRADYIRMAFQSLSTCNNTYCMTVNDPLPLMGERMEGGEFNQPKTFDEFHGTIAVFLPISTVCWIKREDTHLQAITKSNENKLRAFIECSACSKPIILFVASGSASHPKEEREALKHAARGYKLKSIRWWKAILVL